MLRSVYSVSDYVEYGDLTALSDGDNFAPFWTLYAADERRQPTWEQYGYAVKGSTTYAHSTGQMLSQNWTAIHARRLMDSAVHR